MDSKGPVCDAEQSPQGLHSTERSTYLPLSPASETNSKRTSAGRDHNVEVISDVGQLNVLCIEDNDADAFLTARAITRIEGSAKVHRARNGEEGLAFLSKRHPLIDLVLLDLSIPRIDGWGVLDIAHAEPGICSIPIFVLTTSDCATDRERALAKGAKGFLTKPGRFDLLIQELTPVVLRRAARARVA